MSVVIPAYNAERFLRAAFRSITQQTVQPAEIIMIDDTSSDATAALGVQLGARVLSSARNRGPSAARNAGVLLARNPWIAFLDADDVWYDGKLAAQWDALQRWPDTGFCFTDYDVATGGMPLRTGEGRAHPGYQMVPVAEREQRAVRFAAGAAVPGLVRSMFVRQSSVIVARDAFMQLGGYDESLRLAEDYDLFLRMSARKPVISIERSYVLYHRPARSLSADALDEIRSIDDLWRTVVSKPDTYGAETVRAVSLQRVPTLHRGVARALRLGRFTDAKELAARAARIETTPATLAWCVSAALLSNGAGKRLHRALRALWRARRTAVSSN